MPGLLWWSVTIGEYLARTDHEHKDSPLSMMLLRGQVSEKSLAVLPIHYIIVKPIMQPVYPQIIAAAIRPAGKIVYWGVADDL